MTPADLEASYHTAYYGHVKDVGGMDLFNHFWKAVSEP